MSTLLAIRDWLKKNWKAVALAVAFPIGILVLLSKLFRPKIVVTSPELLEHAKLEKTLHEATEKKKEEAAERRDERDLQIEVDFEAQVAQTQKEAVNAVETLKDDPKALNDFLKQVGKDVRSK